MESPISADTLSVMVSLLIPVLLFSAQESRVSVPLTYDVNGRAVDGYSFSESRGKASSSRTERTQSINGRSVPLETVEERVIRNDANGREVERLHRKFDANGRPGPLEKQVIVEQKGPGGSAHIQTTTYRGDLNGNLALAERQNENTTRSGPSATTDITVERTTLNGSFDTVERRNIARNESGKAYQENETVYRKGTNGFYEAQRLIREHNELNGQATDNITEYEVGARGGLAIHDQTVRKTVKHADGSESIEVDLFTTTFPGHVFEEGERKPHLKEQQLIERRPSGRDSVVEVTDVRRPTLADPTKLGPPVKIAEVVCKGNCGEKQ